ncbi:MAG: hypothetical protein KDB23_23085 [Planctomycetales bacterium]|nr:hypothetical protein [Planctomycetales bacterium]
MHANPTRPILRWTAYSLLAGASLLSSGCAKFYHMMHYNCLTRSVDDHHLSYYHSPKTGRIIPKEHNQVCQVEFPCFGYEATCWHRWPEECVGCPVQDSVSYPAESCQAPCASEAPCAPCAQGGAIQDVYVDPYSQGVPVEQPMPAEAMPLDQVTPIEVEPAAPAAEDSAFDQYDLPVASENEVASDTPVPREMDWMAARTTRTPQVETLLIPEVAREELQRTPTFSVDSTDAANRLIGRLPQTVTAPVVQQNDVAVDEVASETAAPVVEEVDDTVIETFAESEHASIFEEDSAEEVQTSSGWNAPAVDAEVTQEDAEAMDELTIKPSPLTEAADEAAPAFELIETQPEEPSQAQAATAVREVVEVASVATFRIKPTLPKPIARQAAATPVNLPPVKMAPVEVKETKPGVSVRFVSDRAASAPAVAEKKTAPAADTSLKFR